MITTSTNHAYDQLSHEWQLVQAFSSDDKVATAHLVQGYYEQDKRFERRKQLADFHPHTSRITSRLVGMLYAQAGEISRRAPVDLDDVGMRGESIDVVSSLIAQTLLLYNAAVVVVQPSGIEVSSPLACPRWSNGAYYTIKGTESRPAGPASNEQVEDVWTLYLPDRFEVYEQETDAAGNKVDVRIRGGLYSESEQPYQVNGLDHPPVLRPQMPWPKALGHEIAKAHRSIFRMESRADASELEAAASTMMQAAIGKDKEFAKVFAAALKQSQTYVPYDKALGEHKAFSLDVDPAAQLRDTLTGKEERLYRTLGQTITENAQQTATGAIINASAGMASTLSTLASVMQDVETQCLQLLSQARSPNFVPAGDAVLVEYPRQFGQLSFDQPTAGQG
jgi:hypothetical protein